jgi:hypothetical protein
MKIYNHEATKHTKGLHKKFLLRALRAFVFQSFLFGSTWLLMGAAPATQPTTAPVHFGDATFDPPAHWQKVERADSVIYVAPDAKEGDSCAIVVYAAKKIPGDFRTIFDAARIESRGKFKLLREGEVTKQQGDGGSECLSVQEVLEDDAGHQSLRSYLACHPGDRFEFSMYVTDTLAGFQKHATEADGLMSSLKFANPGPATQPATTRSASLPSH